MELESSFVIMSGYAATGKTTLARRLVGVISNSVYLQKDSFNRGGLSVSARDFPSLITLTEYLKDDVRSNLSRRTEHTPLGERLQFAAVGDYYGRHVREQAVMGMFYTAKDNVELGKVAVIDCMPIPDFSRGWIRGVVDDSRFLGIPKYLIHCTADIFDLYQRRMDRSLTGDFDTVNRDMEILKDLDAFTTFVTDQQPLIPAQLADFRHLLINSSIISPEQSLEASLEFIKNRENANP